MAVARHFLQYKTDALRRRFLKDVTTALRVGIQLNTLHEESLAD